MEFSLKTEKRLRPRSINWYITTGKKSTNLSFSVILVFVMPLSDPFRCWEPARWSLWIEMIHAILLFGCWFIRIPLSVYKVVLVPNVEELDWWFWETAFKTVMLDPDSLIPKRSSVADFLVEVVSACCGKEVAERSLTDLWWRGLQVCTGWFMCSPGLARTLGARHSFVVWFCTKFAGDSECFSCWQIGFFVSSLKRPNLQRASTLTFSGFINLSTVNTSE